MESGKPTLYGYFNLSRLERMIDLCEAHSVHASVLIVILAASLTLAAIAPGSQEALDWRIPNSQFLLSF